MYMRVEGIDGESRATGFEKWIDIESMKWGVNHHQDVLIGGGVNRTTPFANVEDFTVTKQLDASSPWFMQESLLSRPRKIEIRMTRPGPDGPITYMEYTFYEAIISHYQVGASATPGAPTEEVSFYFKKIDATYYPYDAHDVPGAPVPATLETPAPAPS